MSKLCYFFGKYNLLPPNNGINEVYYFESYINVTQISNFAYIIK